MKTTASWFKGLRGKLLLLVGVPVLLMAGTGIFALNGLRAERDSLALIAHERLELTHSIGLLRASVGGLARYIWLAYGRDTDPVGRKKSLELANENVRIFRDTLAVYGKLHLNEHGRKVFDSLQADWKVLEGSSESVMSLLDQGQFQEAKALMLSTFAKNAAPITSALEEAEKNASNVNARIVTEAMADANRVNSLVSALIALGSVFVLGFGLFTAARLARGLSGITLKIGDSSFQVGSASQQLSTASQQLSSGATEGAASLEETVASIEELSTIVKQNADSSREAANLAQETSRSADQGEAEIRKLIEAMSDIASGSKKIVEIINVIDDIAFQTNLLALNAAVEAARAGEQGKGFAVVAEAVRGLAQRSSEAAKDINGLIKESVSKTEHGARIADRSGTVLKTIVASVKKVSDLNNDIASATRQQSTGIAQISQAMTQLDTVTQGNAASAEEAAASSEEMSSQAVLLQEMVRELTALVEGAKRCPTPFGSAGASKGEGEIADQGSGHARCA